MADEMTGIILAITFGLIGAVTLNLGKAMQKQGIQLFERSKMEGNARAKKGIIWGVGSAFSFIQVFFQIAGTGLSGISGSATIYSAMLGAGIVALVVYSFKVLKEPINKAEITGIMLIMGGTLIFGISTIFTITPSTRVLNVTNLITIMIIIGATYGTMAFYAYKTKNLWGVVFGIIAGSCGGLDNIFKAMSKDTGAIDLGPLSGFGSPFMYMSFAFAGAAFALTNVGYTRAKAVTVVPAYTAFYILIPMLVEALIYGLPPGVWQVAGVATSVAGVILATAFKPQFKQSTARPSTDGSPGLPAKAASN